jgi:hypothetical protein
LAQPDFPHYVTRHCTSVVPFPHLCELAHLTPTTLESFRDSLIMRRLRGNPKTLDILCVFVITNPLNSTVVWLLAML